MNFSSHAYYLVTKGLIETRKIYALIRKDEYDRIAAELQDLLVREWNSATQEAIRDVIRAVNNRATFTNDMLDEMIAALKPRLGAAFAGNVASTMLELQAGTYATGMKDIIGLTPSLNITDNKALVALARYATYPVLHHFDDQLESKIREFGEQIIKGGLNREEAGKLFEDEFAKKYNVKSFRYWQGYANHVVTRSREFGRVSAYERAEIEEVELRAILDRGTTEICRNLHGRIIKVSVLVAARDEMIANSEDPQKIKEIAPWRSAKEIAETKTKDLPSGAQMPGFHFGCRTRTQVTSRITERNQVSGTEMGKQVPRDMKKQLNRYTNEEYGNILQTIRNRRSVNFNETDLNHDMGKHAKAFGFGKDDTEAYTKLARSYMRKPDAILAQVYKNEVQFLFFGKNGYTVVDTSLNFRGLYHHKAENVDQAFEGIRQKALWLQQNKTD